MLENPRLSPDEGFFDAGLDSVLAVELSDGLATALGVEFPVAFLYTHSTAEDLAQLVRELMEEVGGGRG